MKAQGKIKHAGFSFHSTPEELDKILTDHPEMEFVQLQINYADWENPAIKSRECYEVARKHGKPVIIMEPVKGGMLSNPPEKVKEIFDKANKNLSYASWAIKFAANLDGIITVHQEDWLVNGHGLKRATECIKCGKCEEVCPQHIKIREELEKAVKALEIN